METKITVHYFYLSGGGVVERTRSSELIKHLLRQNGRRVTKVYLMVGTEE